jgi:hypothetical protein
LKVTFFKDVFFKGSSEHFYCILKQVVCPIPAKGAKMMRAEIGLKNRQIINENESSTSEIYIRTIKHYTYIEPTVNNGPRIKRGRGVKVQIWPHIILKNNV